MILHEKRNPVVERKNFTLVDRVLAFASASIDRIISSRSENTQKACDIVCSAITSLKRTEPDNISVHIGKELLPIVDSITKAVEKPKQKHWEFELHRDGFGQLTHITAKQI